MIGRHGGADLADQGHRAVDVGVVRDGHVEIDPAEPARLVRRDANLAVRHDVEGAIEVAQLGAAQAEVLDRPRDLADLEHIADVVMVLEQDDEARQVVAHEVLAGKGNRRQYDAEPGDDRSEIEDRQDEDHDEDGDHEPDRRERQRIDRIDPLLDLGGRQPLG